MTKQIARNLRILCPVLVIIMCFGCRGFLNDTFKETVDPETGSIALEGLNNIVTVRRDSLGIPVIEAANFHDLAFATGYVMASDRLAQMVGFSLLGQGRLSEMAGSLTLDIDIFVRTLGIAETARKEYAVLNDDLQEGLVAFSKGVNAYIQSHTDRLPLDFRLSGYSPEPWEPVNSLYIAHALNLGLSFNLSEEIAFLNLARKVGFNKAAWLIPVYPDEPLSFDAADALSTIDLGSMGETSEHLARLHQKMSSMWLPLGIPASNNWGISPERTLLNSSIIANDTHLSLEMPSVWMMLHMRSPEYDGAGIAIAGVPCIIAGYNGYMAWGETMVMGDTQDVFIEQLKTIDGKQFYLYKGEWHPVGLRREVFKVLGEHDQVRTVSSTRHGPLLNMALQNPPKNPALPPHIETAYGLALQHVLSESARSFSAMFDLTRAKTMDDARQAIHGMRFMALNFIYGNKDHIAWQVSGCYPKRKAGRGHFPVPGWTGEYDWDGFIDVMDHPYTADPPAGFLGTANHRTVSADDGLILSSTWYAPERSERIMEMLNSNGQHTWQSSVSMQNDRYDPFAGKLKCVLYDSPISEGIRKEISSWADEHEIAGAQEALDILKNFDGVMAPDSKDAAVFGVFQNVFIQEVFLDELGPENSDAWIAFKSTIQGFYGADQDHMLGREDSPFWDDISTPETEIKSQIMARALAATIRETEKLLGSDRKEWRWGRLLNYQWRTQATQMRPFLSFWKRFAAGIIGGYTDRGPYPGGGDFNTLNVAGFHKGDDYDVWLVPAMRMVVDFGLAEPMFLTNCGGQSGNPASRHYDDGIPVWLNGDARSMPFQDENIKKQYDRVMALTPPQ
ncbi:MAG: penicillin acylase family protein [Desulfobacterales bacterium]|nr:penicillin acylase family protein [Desulfobacterales bacterium]